MDTETFIEAVDEMTPEERAAHFEALMCLALSIEEKDQAVSQNNDEDQ
jgi:hypothetical protein